MYTCPKDKGKLFYLENSIFHSLNVMQCSLVLWNVIAKATGEFSMCSQQCFLLNVLTFGDNLCYFVDHQSEALFRKLIFIEQYVL